MGALLTPEIEEIILDRLLEGESLRAICAMDDIPVTEGAVRKRAAENEEFGTRYARAREIGYDCRAERARDDTKSAEAKENPQAARLEFDAERWYLSKMKPRTYGDKLDVTSGGEAIRPMDDTEKLTRIASIIAAAQERGDD